MLFYVTVVRLPRIQHFAHRFPQSSLAIFWNGKIVLSIRIHTLLRNYRVALGHDCFYIFMQTHLVCRYTNIIHAQRSCCRYNGARRRYVRFETKAFAVFNRHRQLGTSRFRQQETQDGTDQRKRAEDHRRQVHVEHSLQETTAAVLIIINRIMIIIMLYTCITTVVQRNLYV